MSSRSPSVLCSVPWRSWNLAVRWVVWLQDTPNLVGAAWLPTQSRHGCDSGEGAGVGVGNAGGGTESSSGSPCLPRTPPLLNTTVISVMEVDSGIPRSNERGCGISSTCPSGALERLIDYQHDMEQAMSCQKLRLIRGEKIHSVPVRWPGPGWVSGRGWLADPGVTRKLSECRKPLGGHVCAPRRRDHGFPYLRTCKPWNQDVQMRERG